jgi:hypothetical protein
MGDDSFKPDVMISLDIGIYPMTLLQLLGSPILSSLQCSISLGVQCRA